MQGISTVSAVRSYFACAVLGVTAIVASACAEAEERTVPQHGPAYALTVEGAAADVQEVLLEMLQDRMKPIRVTTDAADPDEIGTIHVAMKVFEHRFETSDRKEKTSVPTNLKATVTVTSRGSSNWDGEHPIGFQVDGPRSFSDAQATRRRFAKRLLEVAIKQLPGRGTFQCNPPAAPGE